jgi:hypothetical protein
VSAHRFCRDVCLERGEPLEGTGNTPTRLLMLAWPRGKWRTPRWESIGMSPALAGAVQDAMDAGVHVALVDRTGASDSLAQLHALPESIYADFADERDLVEAIRAYTGGDLFQGAHDPRTTILCCTDSRRDACCARYGFSTYKALAAISDPARFHIVQATHIGGCRFAASLIVMPHRARYGRMTAGQAAAFIDSLERNEVFLPAYKGRADLAEPLQVAELAALRWAEAHHCNSGELKLIMPDLPDDPEEGQELAFAARLPGRTLEILLRAETFHVQGNCGILARDGGEPMLRWCLQGVAEAPLSNQLQKDI